MWDNMETEIAPVDETAITAALVPILPPISQIKLPTLSKADITIPKERSIAHWNIAKGKAVYMSCDMETAGENGGIVQMSTDCFRLDTVHNKRRNGAVSKRKDTAENIRQDLDTFNAYVKPRARAIWS